MPATYWHDLSKVCGTSTTKLIQNDGYVRRFDIQNNSTTATIAVAIRGGTPVLNGIGSVTLGPGAILTMDRAPAGDVSIISSESGAPVTCWVETNRNLNPSVAAAVSALLAQYAAPPGQAYEAAIRTLYLGLNDAGLLPLLAGLWMLAGPDATSARLNWLTGASATAFNSPVFTRGLGFGFTAGSLQYLNTNMVPTSNSLITANTHSLLAFTDGNTTLGANNPAASSGDLEINPKRTAGTFGTKASNTTADTPVRTVYGGMHGLSRSIAGSYKAYEGATEIPIATASDGALTAYSLLIGARPSDAAGTPTANTYYTGTVSAVMLGGAMTTAQIASANSLVSDYLAAVRSL